MPYANKNIHIPQYETVAMPDFEKFDYEIYPYEVDLRLPPPSGGAGGSGGYGSGSTAQTVEEQVIMVHQG